MEKVFSKICRCGWKTTNIRLQKCGECRGTLRPYEKENREENRMRMQAIMSSPDAA
jgi:hypothetical protein